MPSKNNIHIVQQHYQSADKWRIRQQTHDQYTYPRTDFVAWIMKHIPLKGDERVLDVGCGTGLYYNYLHEKFPDMTYVGVDFSSAMLAEHKSDQLSRGQINYLPFADNTFDVVMANHMLYLTPNVEAAIVELRRVLKPGGMLVTATSSTNTMPQFKELFRRAILLVSPPGTSRDVNVPPNLYQRYSLENGSVMLSRHFYAVVRHDLPSALVFPEVDPIMDYLESTRDMREPQLPENVSWAQVMLIMREQISNLIHSLNALVVDKLSGVLIATDSGGFIAEYVEKQNGTSDQS